MTFSASLPMYDWPQIRSATDRFWHAIRDRLGEGPCGLLRGDALWHDVWGHWLDPDLVLSQTCGYPYRTRLHGHVGLVGTPDYGLPGCAPGYYNSVFVTRVDEPRSGLADFATRRFAYNESLSQSGWAAPQTHAASKGMIFTNIIETGAHAASARAVADGTADIAALDAQSWRLMKAFDDFACKLKVIDQTEPTPGLPLITALRRDTKVIFDAVADAIESLSITDRSELGLKGVVRIPAEDYLAVPSPPGSHDQSSPI